MGKFIQGRVLRECYTVTTRTVDSLLLSVLSAFFSRNSMVLMVPEVHSLLGVVSASICRKKEELRGERKSEKGEC
jgi:hypothetical protein